MSGVGVVGVYGLVVVEADGVNAACIDAGFNEFFANGLRAAFAKRAIVFVRAAFVAMSFDFYCVGGVGFEIIGNGSHLGMFRWFHYGAVVFEMDRVGFQGF